MLGQSDDASNRRRRIGSAAVLALALAPLLAGSASAASPVGLGSATSFALLAGSTITNSGPTTVNGDIALCCTGLATPGFDTMTQSDGALYAGTGTVEANAQAGLDAAYDAAASQPSTRTLTTDLSLSGTPAQPLQPGVYESTSHGALQINTGLTLDFLGDPNAVFIFQGTTLATAVGSGGSVHIVNGGAAPSSCNIFWQLSDETQGVTLGTSSAFKGTTMSLGASVLAANATVDGRILTRRSKSVTLDSNTITRPRCVTPAPADEGGSGDTSRTPPAVDMPASPGAATLPAQGGVLSADLSARALENPVASAAAGGTARLSGPSGPVSGPFKVSVTGRAIKSVVFSLDGRRAGSSYAKTGRTKYSLTVRPRGTSLRVHQVTARVTFTTRSRTAKTTLRLTFRHRAATSQQPPRFTG
ncbi:MAG: hypothetical protein QOE31_1321 [Solirubrobacteraceae bacterium]|jgi:hypothetical protein|nr:hypothetical protein [Solirubrobacteraceae bacterium]